MSEASEYVVRCLSSHSAHYDLLTSLKISQAVSLFSDANTQDSLPFGPTHTLNPEMVTSAHMLPVCLKNTPNVLEE